MANTIIQTEKDPMVKWVVEEFERYEKFHRERFEDAAEVIDQWANKPPAKTFDWMNQVHCPITFSSEQTITPRIFSALFPNDSPVEIAVYGDTTEEQGIVIRDTLKHYFRISDVQGESIPALTQNTLIGTGYVEAPYLYRKAWQVNRIGERYVAVVDRRPDCKAVNFFEIFPHPAKLKMDDGLPLIRRRFCDAEYLKRLAESPEAKFENLSKALETESTRSQTSEFTDDKGSFLDLKKRDEYELLEYWGPWDESYLKDDKVVSRKAVPYWITIVNRSVKVRGIPNPYNFQHPPYCKFTLFSDSQPCWFGVGIGTVGKPTQDRLNKIINQRLDNVDLVLNKQGFYNGNDPLINHKKLQLAKPGQWHKVSDTVNSIRWMDTPDVTASSYKEEELAKADYREATGASAPLLPTAANEQPDSAAGINLLQGAAGIRFRPVLKRIETDFISNLAMMYLSHLQQFMVLPEWIKIVTNDGREQPVLVEPEQLQAKVQVIPTGVSETLNKETQIGQLLRFKEVSANDPTINMSELNRRIAELMGFKNIQDILVQQQPTVMGPGELPPEAQEYIQKRLAEGASPDQIKLELLGQPPMEGPEGPMESPQMDVPNERMRGQTPEMGQPVQMPMRQVMPGQMERQ